MKNLHIIPTDKPPIKGDLLLRHLWKGKPNECISWWRYNDTSTYGSVVVYTTLNGSFMDSPSSFKVQHIYITSDEEIKTGDWYKSGKFIWQMKYSQWGEEGQGDAKKIILTTDQDLIKDGVQPIDNKFLEWFVNNPSCEGVEIENVVVYDDNNYGNGEIFHSNRKLEYKIIIPKEEPKQEPCENCNNDVCCCTIRTQETLEEASKKYQEINFGAYSMGLDDAFEEGAKWQQERMYSEEEVRRIAEWSFDFHKTNDFSDSELADEWELRLEKMFKNK
jgi:hypothetical protein